RSSCATTSRTCAADSSLGTLIRSGCAGTIAARSAAKYGLSSALTRTMVRLPVAADGCTARKAATSARAPALRSSATASSRSKDTASATPAQALANRSGRPPGTNSLLRITSPAIAASVRNPHRDQRRWLDVQKIILLAFALARAGPLLQACRPRSRSEEHTSEL